jgi:hypothetical protein
MYQDMKFTLLVKSDTSYFSTDIRKKLHLLTQFNVSLSTVQLNYCNQLYALQQNSHLDKEIFCIYDKTKIKFAASQILTVHILFYITTSPLISVFITLLNLEIFLAEITQTPARIT